MEYDKIYSQTMAVLYRLSNWLCSFTARYYAALGSAEQIADYFWILFMFNLPPFIYSKSDLIYLFMYLFTEWMCN